MDPFLAEIRIFSFNFPPNGWAFCNGQLILITQNSALFSIIGTYYGGNGRTNYGLPNFQGRTPMHVGQGSGLSFHIQGETGGTETVTLFQNQIPLHNHNLMAAPLNSQSISPTNNSLGRGNPVRVYNNTIGAPDATMATNSIAPSGGNLPHNNMMPYLTMNFCIALQGIFPARG